MEQARQDAVIRLVTIGDMAQILEVQKEAYPEYYWEAQEAYIMKLQLAPETCFGAFDDANHTLLGYGIALPMRTPGMTIPLDSDNFDGIVDIREAACIYMHDFAIRLSSARTGLGTALFLNLLNLAKKHEIQLLELVAVRTAISSAMPYWKKHGFAECGEAKGGYGAEAVKMTRSVPLSQ
jgi:GNAT superfamily N-acetyltransferase